jgi:hypothetical protein
VQSVQVDVSSLCKVLRLGTPLISPPGYMLEVVPRQLEVQLRPPGNPLCPCGHGALLRVPIARCGRWREDGSVR